MSRERRRWKTVSYEAVNAHSCFQCKTPTTNRATYLKTEEGAMANVPMCPRCLGPLIEFEAMCEIVGE